MNEEYLHLFNTITRTMEQLDALKTQLILAQAQAEELYLKRTD